MSLVLAAEKEEAAGKRFLIVADQFCNKQIVEIIRDKFPQFRDALPTGEVLESGGFPAAGVPDFDNRRSVEVLGMRYRSLAESIEDVVKSMQTSFIRKVYIWPTRDTYLRMESSLESSEGTCRG